MKKLYYCKIDPKAVTKSRAANWLQVFPEFLQPTALEGFIPTKYGVDWKFACFSHEEARLGGCRLSMPEIFSRVREGPWLSQSKDTPV
jgi:hypothetical protein